MTVYGWSTQRAAQIMCAVTPGGRYYGLLCCLSPDKALVVVIFLLVIFFLLHPIFTSPFLEFSILSLLHTQAHLLGHHRIAASPYPLSHYVTAYIVDYNIVASLEPHETELSLKNPIAA